MTKSSFMPPLMGMAGMDNWDGLYAKLDHGKGDVNMRGMVRLPWISTPSMSRLQHLPHLCLQ
jgi:hypothetical protein